MPDGAPVTPVLEVVDLTKSFGQVTVLRDACLTVGAGEIHGLVGHNGAGKSTLVRLVQGVERPTSGHINIGGERVDFKRPDDAHAVGVRMVFQELSLFPDLTVADNIFIHAEIARAGVIRGSRQHEEAAHLLGRIGAGHIDPRVLVGDLGIADQQMVEVAKAIRYESRLLILDEPTGSLSKSEIGDLYAVMRRAAAEGLGIVFITHHLNELFEICDSVTVLRDGRVALQTKTAETTLDAIVEAIVGDVPTQDVKRRTVSALNDVRLRVTGLSVPGKLDAVDVAVRSGEVVGIAGLAGSGRSTLLKSILGEIRAVSGTIEVSGRRVTGGAPGKTVSDGIAYIPENRKTQGLVLDHSVLANTTLSSLAAFARWIFFRARLAENATRGFINRLEIKALGPEQPVTELSGGNQQKVVLAKALATQPRVMLLDEPTRGVDIGAAAKITSAVLDEVERGMGALWVSSDLDELVRVSDRVLLLRDGSLHEWRPSSPDRFSQRALLADLQRPIAHENGVSA